MTDFREGERRAIQLNRHPSEEEGQTYFATVRMWHGEPFFDTEEMGLPTAVSLMHVAEFSAPIPNAAKWLEDNPSE